MEKTNTVTVFLKNKTYEFIETFTDNAVYRIRLKLPECELVLKFYSMQEHRPAHLHCICKSGNSRLKFRFNVEKLNFLCIDDKQKHHCKQQELKDIKAFQKLDIYPIFLLYLQQRQEKLIDSFYTLNPNLDVGNQKNITEK